MSTLDMKTSEIISAVIIFLLLALLPLWWIWQFYGGIFSIISVFFVLFVSVSLIVFGAHKYLLGQAEAAEPMVDPNTDPVYYEESTPEDIDSKASAFSCPDCGYKDPRDADFCIRCGQDLDLTDDVSR